MNLLFYKLPAIISAGQLGFEAGGAMKDLRLVALAMQLGWMVVFSLLIPLVLGLWADKKLDTMPLFTVIGVILGTLIATVGVYRWAVSSVASAEPDREVKKPEDKEGQG
ncbi:MAG: AtpZ/AtpI family protein [Anaerolineae bacterium]